MLDWPMDLEGEGRDETRGSVTGTGRDSDTGSGSSFMMDPNPCPRVTHSIHWLLESTWFCTISKETCYGYTFLRAEDSEEWKTKSAN